MNIWNFGYQCNENNNWLLSFHVSRKNTYLPAISWYVLVIIKSALFIEIRSAVNWQVKWYLSSYFFQYISESGYFVFSNAWAMLHYMEKFSKANINKRWFSVTIHPGPKNRWDHSYISWRIFVLHDK